MGLSHRQCVIFAAPLRRQFAPGRHHGSRRKFADEGMECPSLSYALATLSAARFWASVISG